MRAQPRGSHYVEGTFVDGDGPEFESIHPADGSVIARLRAADTTVIEQATDAAHRAFGLWSQTAPVERGRVLRRAAEAIRERNHELSVLESLDTGKPLQETLVADAASGADCLEYFAGLISTDTGQYIDLGSSFAYTRRDWRPAVALLITLLLVQSGAEHLKGVFERSGPGGLAPESFPSGHAALAVLVWGYVAWFVPRALRRPFGAFVFVASMIVLIGSVVSRVALDAHWFTDVLAGVGLGAAALVLAREVTSVPLVRRVWVATVPRRTVSHRSQPG